MNILLQEWKWLVLVILLNAFHFNGGMLQAQIEAELERQFICKGDCIDWEPIITQGAAPYSFSWSTGEEQMIISLCPNDTKSYKLTITDANEDSLVVSELIFVAPVDRTPIPKVTTPICLGETAYFSHPNWTHAPDYYWVGPDGIKFETKDPIIENITEEDEGEYYLYLEYYDSCITDSISVFLEVEDIGSKSSCEKLGQCNFACNVSEMFDLRGRTTQEVSDGIQPVNFCSDDGGDAVNIKWFGFVAQEGEHVIKFRAINCEGDGEGLRFGIYDDCEFSNLVQCTESCSKEVFEIPSSMLIPGNSYYAYAEGCGTNICDYVISVEGSTQSALCNDYVSFDTATDWKVEVGFFGGSSTFWYNYLRDTTINNRVYRIIGVDGETSGSGLLLREDKQKRVVYSYHTQSNSDKVLYDFSLEVGDEYNVEFFNDPFIVTDITLVPSNIGPLKKWNFTSQIGGHSMSYTEAIGGNYLPFPANVLISDPVYYTSAIFSNCTAIISDDVDEINIYRSVFDTTYVSLCEGEEFMGYSESVIFIDTIAREGGCFDINVIDLNFTPMGGVEIPYNGIDDDCNPQTPDDDLDQDGFLLMDDCDDSNSNINPNQVEEIYNGIDDDCNPETLDDDLDQDGFILMNDCNDNNASINPDQLEIAYNGLDDDCNANTLDDDLDQDGFLLIDDCDDSNSNINPNQLEEPYNGIDDDCNSETLDDDIDQDGFGLINDCNDNNAAVNPNQSEEPYNGIDDDCDVNTLDDDLDQDGFLIIDDCDDTNPSINPDADEIPGNEIDEDCDGEDIISSTNEWMKSIIRIYPNPISDVLYVRVIGGLKYTLCLYSSSGKLIQKVSNEDHMNLKEVPNGFYLLQIRDQDSGSQIVEKIIVDK